MEYQQNNLTWVKPITCQFYQHRLGPGPHTPTFRPNSWGCRLLSIHSSQVVYTCSTVLSGIRLSPIVFVLQLSLQFQYHQVRQTPGGTQDEKRYLVTATGVTKFMTTYKSMSCFVPGAPRWEKRGNLGWDRIRVFHVCLPERGKHL